MFDTLLFQLLQCRSKADKSAGEQKEPRYTQQPIVGQVACLIRHIHQLCSFIRLFDFSYEI